MTFQDLEVTLPKTIAENLQKVPNRWLRTIWFWNVCEKEYYSCDPVNAGFGKKKLAPLKVILCIK